MSLDYLQVSCVMTSHAKRRLFVFILEAVSVRRVGKSSKPGIINHMQSTYELVFTVQPASHGKSTWCILVWGVVSLTIMTVLGVRSVQYLRLTYRLAHTLVSFCKVSWLKPIAHWFFTTNGSMGHSRIPRPFCSHPAMLPKESILRVWTDPVVIQNTNCYINW